MPICSIENNMRTLRFNNGEMTQQDLAKQIGVTRQIVIAIESRKYFPTLELVFKIAGVFKLPLEEIFQYDSDKA